MSEIAVSQPTTALAPMSEALSLLNIIATAAENPNVDVVKLQALLDMQERVVAKQAEGAFNKALARLSANMPRVKKNGRVDLGKGGGGYDFAKWEDMDAVIRPLMRQEGFTLSFNTASKDGGGATILGTLLHEDGHSRTVSIPLALDSGAGRNNLQAMGSTLSYGKRYCAEMLLNIVREGVDDDGQDGGTDRITADEAAQIRKELDDLGGSHAGFLKYMGVGSIEQIKAADFRKAVASLATKRRQGAGGQP